MILAESHLPVISFLSCYVLAYSAVSIYFLSRK